MRAQRASESHGGTDNLNDDGRTGLGCERWRTRHKVGSRKSDGAGHAPLRAFVVLRKMTAPLRRYQRHSLWLRTYLNGFPGWIWTCDSVQ